MPSDPYKYVEPPWVGKFIQADADRKLSTEQRVSSTAKKKAVKLTAEEIVADLANSISDQSFKEIDLAIAPTNSASIRDILLAERMKMEDILAQRNEFGMSAAQKVQAPASMLDSLLLKIQSLWR